MKDKNGVEHTTDADILLYHRNRGFLTLELKAGAISRYGEQWFSRGTQGTADIANPVAQAFRAALALQGGLRQALEGLHGQGCGVAVPEVRWGVYFPNVEETRKLSAADLPAERILGRECANRSDVLLERMLEIFAIAQSTCWVHVPASPKIEALLFAFLDGHSPAPRLCELLRVDEQAMVEATSAQQQVIEALRRNARLMVEGGPGSGKSLLARWSAAELAKEGKRVLLLCFNRLLAEENDQLLGRKAHIECRTFHDFARQMIEQAGGEWKVPANGDADFWNIEVPLLLEEALGALPEERFEALVVDEAQDLDASWWPILLQALRNSQTSKLRIFRDLRQDLFKRNTELPSCLQGLVLCDLPESVRCTRRIAGWLGITPHEKSPEGVPVREIEPSAKSPSQVVLSLLTEWFKQGIDATRILIVACTRREKSVLEKAELRDVAMWCEAKQSLDMKKVNIVTVHRAKGLEADAVLLVDVGETTPRERILVGGSRARHVLAVLRV